MLIIWELPDGVIEFELLLIEVKKLCSIGGELTLPTVLWGALYCLESVEDGWWLMEMFIRSINNFNYKILLDYQNLEAF